MAWENVSWTDLVNCIASPDANDLTKNAGVDGAWDAGARSIQEIASAVEGAGVEFATWWGGACGLSADNPGQHYNTIDFCFLAGWGDIYSGYIYENGVFIMDAGLWSKNRIIINALGQIEYWGYDEGTATWSLIYTSLVAPSFPLFVDTSIAPVTWPPQIFDVLINGVVVAKIDHLPLLGVH